MITIHIPETVSPAGLRARADIMRGFMDESCAHHLELAAARIEQLEAALRAIIIRCEEGDKKSDWLPTISNIARAAISQSSPPEASD